MAIMMKIMVNNGIWGHPIFRGSGNRNILPYTDRMRCTTAVQKRTHSESLSQKEVVVKGELWRWLHLLLQLSNNVQHDPQIWYDLEDPAPCLRLKTVSLVASPQKCMAGQGHWADCHRLSTLHTLVDFVSKAKEQAHNALVFHGCCGRWLSWARHLLKVLFGHESRKEWKMNRMRLPNCRAGLPFQSKVRISNATVTTLPCGRGLAMCGTACTVCGMSSPVPHVRLGLEMPGTLQAVQSLEG